MYIITYSILGIAESSPVMSGKRSSSNFEITNYGSSSNSSSRGSGIYQSEHVGYIGVLPYSKVPERFGRSRMCLLLGREHKQSNWNDQEMWSDFGGVSEMQSVGELAVKELYEETMGLLGSKDTLRTLLHSKTPVDVFDGGKMFIVEIPYQPDIATQFRRVWQYFSGCTRVHPAPTANSPKCHCFRSNPNGGISYKPGYPHLCDCPDGMYEKTEMRYFSLHELDDILGNTWDEKLDGPVPKLRPAFMQSAWMLRERLGAILQYM